MKFVLGSVKNIMGKGENAGYQHFLLFPQCFQKLTFPEMSKAGLCGKRLKQVCFVIHKMLPKWISLKFCCHGELVILTVFIKHNMESIFYAALQLLAYAALNLKNLHNFF